MLVNVKLNKEVSSYLSPGVNVAIRIKYGHNGKVYIIQQGYHRRVLSVQGDNLKRSLSLNANFTNLA